MLWVAGIFFLILRKLTGRIKKDWGKLLGYAMLVLAVFALAFAPLPFINGSLATWAAQIAGWALGMVGTAIGVPTAVIAGTALVLLLLFTAFDLKDRKPDAVAKTTVYLVPVLALLASGPLAANLLELIHTVGGVGPQVVGSIT